MSYNNYHHAHIVISKLERKPPIAYKALIVVASFYNTYRPFVATTYYWNNFLPSTNLKHNNYLLIIIFHGKYPPIVGLFSYSISEYKNIFIVKKQKNQTNKLIIYIN